jgi:ribose transport system permease protein
MSVQSNPSVVRALAARMPRANALVWALCGLALACLVVEPGTLSSQSLLSMLPFAAILAIAGIGQGLTIQQRGIDFSIPGTISLAAVILTRFADGDNGRLAAAVFVAVGAGVVVGLANGVAITKLHITPLIATLAVNALVLGVISSYSGETAKSATDSLSGFAVDKTLGVPNTVLAALAIVAIGAFVLARTTAGRRFTAVATSPAAGRAAGLRVDRITIATYVLAAVAYTIAGVLLAGYVKTPAIDVGNGYLLASITAVIIGGTPLGGGKGKVIGTALAALFLTQLTAFTDALGAPASTSLLVQASAIAIAVLGRSAAAGTGVRRWVAARRRPEVV